MLYYNTETGQIADESDLRRIPVFVFEPELPAPWAYLTDVEDPVHNPLTHKVVIGAPIKINMAWYRSKTLEPLTQEELTGVIRSLKIKYVDALNKHMDTVAGQRHYDTRYTCALRAGYPGPFQPEGIAYATWMDTCNHQAYAMMDAVLAGQRPPPATMEAFIAEFPPMVWPDPVV